MGVDARVVLPVTELQLTLNTTKYLVEPDVNSSVTIPFDAFVTFSMSVSVG